MEKANYVFKRKEKKYMLSKEQYINFKAAMGNRLLYDDYGKYTVCNIYYDTLDDILIRRSIEKPVFKEKLRIRWYGEKQKVSVVFIELKKKYKGIVYKRRIGLSPNKAKLFMEGKIEPKEQKEKEIAYFIKKYKTIPKLFLAYDREACTCEDEIRITFDTNIRSRRDELEICLIDRGRPLFCGEYYLMEIKTAGAMPIYLAKILSELKIYPQSFSKYGNIYKKELEEKSNACKCIKQYN